MPPPAPSSESDGEAIPRPLTRRQALGILGSLALPWSDLLAQNVAAPAGPPAGEAANLAASTLPPDLTNLHPVMEWMAREHSPRLSFLDSQWRSLEAWKRTARPVFQNLLQYQPVAPPRVAELVRREKRDGFVIEVVNIPATPAYHIPARVLLPTGQGGRRPAVVALHCHGGRFTWGHEKILSASGDSPTLYEYRERYYGRPWAEALVRRGYVVIVIDAFYFGARRLRVEEMSPARVFSEVRAEFDTARSRPPQSPEWIAAVNRVCAHYEHLTAKTIIAAGGTWPGLLVWDDRRTVDYLASRPEVDPERIGCAGLSLGGIRAAYLVAADPRIKVASITGWLTVFAQQLRNHLRNHTGMAYIPGLSRFLDLPDAVALHAPGALLVQQCRRDILYPVTAMEAAVEQLTRIYAKAGIPDRFRGTFYDEPHSFKPRMQEESFAWFDQWL